MPMEVLRFLEDVPGGPYAVAAVAGLVGVALFSLCCVASRSGRRSETAKKPRSLSASESEGEEVGSKQQSRNKGPKLKQQQPAKKVTLPPHPLLAAEFKGHTGSVLSLDFDTNGKYLASCSDDRTIRLWYLKTLEDKEHKYTRKNLDLDYATHVKFSPDGTAVVVTLAVANTVRVYRIMKAQKNALSDTGVEFPKLSSSSILALDIATTGKFIMTFDVDGFTVWTLKGEKLASVSTLQSPNTFAAVSPCGKFVACAGFTSDVKLWEVEFSKSGEYQKVSKAMDLMGHRASVLSLSFSADSHRVATASKDSTWKYWDIDVEYKLREDPKLLMTGDIPRQQGDLCVSLSPDSRVVAVAASGSIFLFSTTSGNLLQTLDGVHRGVITALCWDPCSLYLVSAGGEDRHVRVWHNACGMRELIADLEAKLPKASSAPLQRRIQGQLKDTRARLLSIENTD